MHPVKVLLGDASGLRTDHKYTYYFMRGVGRFHRLRSLGRFVSKPDEHGTLPMPGQETLFASASREQVLADLRRDGFARGLALPSAAVEEVLEHAYGTEFCPNSESSLPPMRYSEREELERASGKRVIIGDYRNLSECPVVQQIGRDPFLLDLARAYLGTPPRLTTTALLWSFPAGHGEAEQSAAAQLFHFDLDDFRQLKVFFYLTEVDESAGPHVAVKGTHRYKRFSHEVLLRRLPDEEIVRAYGAESIERFCMPAGSGFVEDTYCLHKGQSPTGRERLMLAFNYGINDFYFAAHDAGRTEPPAERSELVRQ